MTPPPAEAAAIARLPAPQDTKAANILAAAAQLLPSLERGAALDARILREAMTAAFEASDTDGAWLWKDAYEASEAAAVLFLRKYGSGMLRKAGGPARYLAMLERLSALLPSHTRRSEESDEFQQFSTPLGLGFLMVHAAQLPQGALMLEPSAGTGLLAIHAETAGAALALNELAETRHAVLSGLFPKVAVTRFNAEQIDDYLGAAIAPATVVMNPPFSASPNIARTMRDATARHIRSALRRLPQGGRLVALTHSSHDPADSAIAELYREPGVRTWLRLHRDRGRPHLCAPRHERRYAPHRHRPHAAAGAARPCGPCANPRRIARLHRERPAAARACHRLSPSRHAGGIRRSYARRPGEVPRPRLGSASGSLHPPPSREQARRRGTGLRDARGVRPGGAVQRPHLRTLRGAKHRHRRSQAASDQARAVGGHGVRPRARSFLPAPSAVAG